MRSGLEEVRVQRMQVHNGFSSRGSLRRRSSADGSICGSANAHASLRRFAEGYVFGTAARLGLGGNGNSNVIADQQSCANSPFVAPFTRASLSNVSDEAAHHHDAHHHLHQQHCASTVSPPMNASGPTFGALNDDYRDDFASRALASSAPGAHNNFFMSAANNCVQIEDRFSSTTATAMDKGANYSGNGRRRRERHALVFADRSLPVRERIERKCQPQKRLRDNVTVDALADLMGRVLTTKASSSTSNASVSPSASTVVVPTSVSSVTNGCTSSNTLGCTDAINLAAKGTGSFHVSPSSAIHRGNDRNAEDQTPSSAPAKESVNGHSSLVSSACQSSPITCRRRNHDRHDEEELQQPRQRRRRQVTIKTGSEVCVADAPVPLRDDDDVRIGGDSHGLTDDDDTADELSFLVQQCDLEPETKQSHFMPYIT